MFGLSVSKILLLVLIVGAVIVGTRVLGRIRQDKNDEARRAPEKVADDGSVELVECPKCGTFVTPGKPVDCTRTGCPYAA